MPEVRTLLESQLTRPDRHFTETAVFGWRFGLLYWLDADWLRAHTERIFELRTVESTPSSAFGWAAWNTFLFSHRPHVEFYRILREQFSYAVDHAVGLSEPQESREQPFARLGEHLIVIYGRGDLGAAPEEAWVADDRIIQRLVTTTHASVRTHAVEFVGQSLQGSEGEIPEPVLGRFRFLWERYWDAVGEADAAADPDSRVFGYWFSSGAFDAEWSLPQMEAFVNAAPKADPDHMILERLAALAQFDPARCARIVGALVDGDDEGWRISSWENDARTVLSIALQASGDAPTIARGVIDRLGRRGFLNFGKLLSHESGT
ncbi:MAG: hypothetical protein JXO22_04900 [Phycisphaerae bacterium]|nr:hypothetical protein [Phycisphaerae bacterium]